VTGVPRKRQIRTLRDTVRWSGITPIRHSTFDLSSDGYGGTVVIDPPQENFNFASAGGETNVPATPPVSIGGVRADAFVFQPYTAVGRGGPEYSGIDGHRLSEGYGLLDGHGLQPEHKSLVATANAAPSNHPWFDDTGPGHVGSIAETHMGHFIIH
jgi:hypothetical protein